MVNGPLFLFRTDHVETHGAADGKFPLSPGKFLIKVCVDRNHRLAADPAQLLGADDLVGQAEITAHWQTGFPKAEGLSATELSQ